MEISVDKGHHRIGAKLKRNIPPDASGPSEFKENRDAKMD
jgi:hypothetical protein